MQRVLSVSLSHAIRGAAFVLLPFAFVALIAWATAGSATGTTTDPIRGALWIWLGSHHIPFAIALPPSGAAGYFSFLPWGAIALPFLAVRISFKRSLERLQGDYHDIKGVRIAYSLFYTIIVTALSYLSASPAVTSQWYLAPIFAFTISMAATLTCGTRIRIARPIEIAIRLLSIIVGVSLIAVGILIFTKLGDVKLLTEGLQPGIFGGILLLVLNIFYLPNAAIAFASYLAGSGFALGADTLISPWWYRVDQLPVFPLLGITPLDRHPMFLLGTFFFIGIGVLLAYWTLSRGISLTLQTSLYFIIGLLLLAYLSSGSLMTDEMGAMGVSIWKFGLLAIGEVFIGAAATTVITSRTQR